MKTFENAFDKFKQNVKSVDLGKIPLVVCYNKGTSKLHQVVEVERGKFTEGREITAREMYDLAKRCVPVYFASINPVQAELMPTLNIVPGFNDNVIVVYFWTECVNVNTNTLINRNVTLSIDKSANTVTMTEASSNYNLASLKK